MGCCDKKADSKSEIDQDVSFTCPKCHSKGVKVKLITPLTLLKDCCKSKIDTDLLYKFCKNTECDIAYYSNDPNNLFTRDDLKVKATLKDKGLDVHVCYCFNHTRQSVLDEIRASGTSTVVENIKAKMKDPGCFCETSNPQGGCCLANNMAWVKEAKEITKE